MAPVFDRLSDTMSDRLTGILGHQTLELSFRLLVVEVRAPGAKKNARNSAQALEALYRHPNCFDARLWRFNPKQGWRLAIFNTPPELPLGGDNQVLVERVGMNLISTTYRRP